MIFTDDDLKRLKDSRKYESIDPDKIDALLARLEAAEDVILQIQHAKLHKTCALRASDISLEVWRKAAGKSQIRDNDYA